MKLKADPQTRLRLVRALAMNGERLRAQSLLDETPDRIKFLPLYGRALAAFKTDLPDERVEELRYSPPPIRYRGRTLTSLQRR